MDIDSVWTQVSYPPLYESSHKQHGFVEHSEFPTPSRYLQSFLTDDFFYHTFAQNNLHDDTWK